MEKSSKGPSLVKDLTTELFEKYPVWIWDESNEFMIPVLDYEPLPDDEPVLFIKATFESKKGNVFDGYLIGDDISYHAFGLFHKGVEYVFNLNLPNRILIDIKKMFEDREASYFLLFPLQYKSELFFEDKKPIEGVFDISE